MAGAVWVESHSLTRTREMRDLSGREHRKTTFMPNTLFYVNYHVDCQHNPVRPAKCSSRENDALASNPKAY